MKDPQRIDTALRAVIAGLVVAVLGFGGWFGYSVYRDRVAAENAVPAIRLMRVLEAQVKRTPNDAVLRVRLGEAYGAAGKTQRAIEELNAALKIEPKHTGAFMDLGILAMQNNRADEAKGYFTKVIELTQDSEMANSNERRETAFFNLGVLVFKQRRYDEAIGYFKAALRIRNDASDTYMYLAQSFEAIDQNRDAESAVRTALRFDPNLAQGHYLLGKLLLADGDKLHASAEIGRAIELAPDAPEPRKFAEQFGKPESLRKMATDKAESDPESALEAALTVFNLDRSGNIPSGKLAGKLLVARGDKSGARDVYTRVAEVAPDDADVAAAIKALTTDTKKR